MSHIRVELLLGRKVRDSSGELIGRIEEIRGEHQGDAFVVDAFLVGAAAVVDRFAARGLWHIVRRVLGRPHAPVYRIEWAELDLSDPRQPRTLGGKDAMRRVRTSAD